MLGPYYKGNAPFKERLGEGVNGERLIITGNILDMSCQSLKDAILDMWQVNSSGNYYNEGFSLRDIRFIILVLSLEFYYHIDSIHSAT